MRAGCGDAAVRMDAPGGARKRSFVVPSRGGQDEGAREGRTQRQGHGTSELFQRLCRNSGSNAAAASSDRADSVARSRSAQVGEGDRMQLSSSATEPADGMTVPAKMDEKRACPPAQRVCTAQEHHPAAVTAAAGENQLPVSNDMFYALLEEAGNRHADGHLCADDDDTPMDEVEDGDRASADLDRTNADRIAAAEIAAAPPASCTAQLHCDEQRTGSCQPAPTEAKRMQSIDCVSPQPAQSDSSQRVLSESRRSPAEDTGVNTHIAVAELAAEPSSACATLGPDTARIVPALKDQDSEFPRPIDRLVAACGETTEEMDHGPDDMAEDDAVIAGLDSNARAGAATGESDKQTSPGETTDSAKEEHAHPRVHSQAVSTHEPPTGGCATAAPEQEPRGVLKKTRGSEAPAPVEQIVPLLPPPAAGASSLTKDAQAQAVHFPGAAVGSGTSLPPLQHGALAPPTPDGSAPLAPSLCLFRMLSAARDTRDAAARAARAEDRDDLAEALAAYGQASEAAGTYMHYYQELITQATTPGAMDPNDCRGVKSADTPLADASKQFSLLTSVVLSSRQVFGERAEVIRHLAAEYAHDVVPQPQVVTMQAIGRGESCDGNDRSSPGINQTTLAWKDANGSELDGGPIMVPVTRPHGGYAFYQPNAAISNGGYDPDYDSQYADVAQQSLHEPVVTFEDISGLDELKTELYESVVLPGVWPEAYAAPLRAASVAVLLHGPPGTGKSMLAEAAANEGGLRMLLVKPSVVLSKYFGDSEKGTLCA